MQRYKLTIEYNGYGLVGWQRQENGPSAQQILEEAVEKFCGQQTLVYGSGRTDAGVHALGQVAHVDLPSPYAPYKIQGALNHYVKPFPISVLEVEAVTSDFHARFSAKSRTYIYKILARRAPPTLLQHKVWHVRDSLNIPNMHEAAQVLIGTHDLSSFRAAACQAKSAWRSITSIEVRQMEEIIEIEISAPSFLHNQVRIIVGCLYEVGIGKWKTTKLEQLLTARDRTKAARTAPPEGLYFAKVKY
jgi:tRNA pseudouridine38-40 synthase